MTTAAPTPSVSIHESRAGTPRVLMVVGDSFPPMPTPGSMRMGKFAQYLPEHGWHPIVLATDQAYDFEATFADVRSPHVHVERVRQLDPVKRAFFFKKRTRVARGDAESLGWASRQLARAKRAYPRWVYPDRDWLWYPIAVRAGSRLLRSSLGADVRAVASSAPTITCHRVARAIARTHGLPWVADFRDFWALSTLRPPRPGWRRAAERRLEASLCRDADVVVSISEPYTARFAEAYGLSAERTATIPNGFDPADFPPVPRPVRRPRRFSIAHAGSFYGGDRDPRPLFQALRQLADAGHVDLADVDLDFYGPRCPIVAARAETFGLSDRVRWRGFVDFEVLVPRLMGSYLLLVVTHDTDDTITSKVFDYMGCRRPILALAPAGGSLERIVNQGGVGRSFDHEDVRGLARALATWMTRFRGGDPASIPASAAGLTEYSRPAQAARFAEVLTSIAGRPHRVHG